MFRKSLPIPFDRPSTALLPLLASLILIVFATAPASADISGGGSTCYNCDNFGGAWDCTTTSLFGGTSCTVSEDSCSVSGDCGDSGSVAGVAAVSATLVREIATRNPRVAATLWTITEPTITPSQAWVHWFDTPLTAQQVDALIETGSAGTTPSQGSIVHKVTFDTNETEFSTLEIVPTQGSTADPTFSSFVLELRRDPESGVYVPTSWSLF